MSAALMARSRRIGLGVLGALALGCLGLGAASAARFTPMDAALMQITFYGAGAAALGAHGGGLLGAAIEEDACGELDMGMMSSLGAILGAWVATLGVTAAAGLGLVHGPLVPGALYGASVLGYLGVMWPAPLGLARAPGFDERGYAVGPDHRRLPDEQQPWRMRDRLAVLLGAAALSLLGLTLAMGWIMGSELGHPVMMAGMMYGMSGPMIGGLVGGWIAGILDEHWGDPVHDNPIMVAGMASMSGMMGAMPAGMVGGMMAIMGDLPVGLTIGTAIGTTGLSYAILLAGRWRWVPAAQAVRVRRHVPGEIQPAPQRVTGGAWLRVEGMSCAACCGTISRAVSGVPGVAAVEVDLEGNLVQVRWGPGFPGLGPVYSAIEEAGYAVLRA